MSSTKKNNERGRYRHELKYLISLDDAERFFKDCLPFCGYDKHTDDTHSYEISSVYYDTSHLRFFYDREESIGYRRKIRLRTYNRDNEALALFIEIKEKHGPFVAKKRINLKNTDILKNFDRHDQIPLETVMEALEDSAEAREMDYLHGRLKLQPIVMIRYIRKILVPKFEHDMRITLDTRITAGGSRLPQYDKDQEKLLIAPSDGVLEIKTNQNIPLWLHSVMGHYELVQTRYSKYCLGVEKLVGEGLYLNSVDRDISLAEDEYQKTAVGQ